MKTTSMLSQLAKVKGVTLCTLLVGIVAGVVNAVQPFLLKKVLDNLQALQPFSVILLVAAIISYTGLSALQEYLRARIAYTVTADVRTRLARHLCEVPLSSFDDHPKGDLLARFGDDSVQVGKALNDGVVGACSAVLGFLFAFVGMLSIDVTLLISVLLCVGFGSVLSLLTSKTLEGKSLYAQEANGELMTAFDRIITALPVLKAYNAESLEGAKIVRSILSHYARSMRLVALQAIVKPLGGIIVQVALFVSLGIGVYRVSIGALTVGSLVAFAMYLTMMITPASQIMNGIAAYRAGKGAIVRVDEILSIAVEDAKLVAIGQSEDDEYHDVHDAVAGNGVLSFNEVTYRYDGETEPFMLGPLSFSVESGSRTAIVGQSGSGKSTILSLVERFRSPQSGVIRFLGKKQNEYQLAAYRNYLAYVDQGNIALGGTLRENLMLANPDVSDSDLQTVLSAVGLQHFVSRLDVDLGDAGGRLSGGERQRISWARFLLNRYRPLLVLDEPSSSVDAVSAAHFTRMLDCLPSKSTVILVTHNLHQVIGFDQIIVMQHGHMVGSWSHDELLRGNRFYRRMAENQGMLAA